VADRLLQRPPKGYILEKACCQAEKTPMRVIALVLLSTPLALAQVPPAGPPSACGPENASFNVKRDDAQHSLTPADPGKARVYFIHDAGSGWTAGYPTVKIAVDGSWVGANHGNSYFSVSVDPGEHHVCVALQSSLVGQRLELAHFTAAPDTVYYYRTRLVLSRSVELLDLEPIDSDQGKYLIESFPAALSKPKK
jgi:hypothetical protein